MSRARRDDEVVVGDLAIDQFHNPPLEVDGRRFGEDHIRIFLVRDDRSNRICDVARIERRGGDLIEQRLEEMKIAAVDDRDVRRRFLQDFGGVEPAKAAAEDDDAR